ncbi:hypothetical protein SAMN05216353_10228 [Halobacillus alkaliphilus]|uniref:Uncharacterized protein n=1 Tax=Halobacillus alkaliphilus TaxID=396056 RepID=A0A1I2JWB3_9BACI|nr:hypothetical protein [Halobacillus alkaliphilus]SFF57076.1 hypothetical protein SAMN05216353_10228 [Halobacillus alkaliphilus]
MRAFLLLLAAAGNVFFITTTLFWNSIRLNGFWLLFFGTFLLFSLLFSGYVFVKKRRQPKSFLSIGSVMVLSISAGSIGWYSVLAVLAFVNASVTS